MTFHTTNLLNPSNKISRFHFHNKLSSSLNDEWIKTSRKTPTSLFPLHSSISHMAISCCTNARTLDSIESMSLMTSHMRKFSHSSVSACSICWSVPGTLTRRLMRGSIISNLKVLDWGELRAVWWPFHDIHVVFTEKLCADPRNVRSSVVPSGMYSPYVEWWYKNFISVFSAVTVPSIMVGGVLWVTPSLSSTEPPPKWPRSTTQASAQRSPRLLYIRLRPIRT